MKKIFLTLCVFCASCMYAQDITTATNLGRYAEDSVDHAPKVVFIGNSISELWANLSPEFFAENDYLGRGISGQTSPQLLLRFRQDVINLHPSAVVINAGTNDIAMNTGAYMPQFTLSCIQSMAELAHYNGIKVILSSVLPAGKFWWNKDVEDVAQKISELNVKIKEYADSKGFAYIDYHSAMCDEKGEMKDGYSVDGVHPKKEGYAVMEQIAKETINRVLAQ